MNDKDRIILFMMHNHQGFRNSAPRQEIAKALGYKDRTFRKICASIPEVITNSNIKSIQIDFFNTVKVRPGYYILPLVDHNGIEAKIALCILKEMWSRSKELRERALRGNKAISEKYNKQAVFA